MARQAKKAGLSSRWLAKSLSYNLVCSPMHVNDIGVSEQALGLVMDNKLSDKQFLLFNSDRR